MHWWQCPPWGHAVGAWPLCLGVFIENSHHHMNLLVAPASSGHTGFLVLPGLESGSQSDCRESLCLPRQRGFKGSFGGLAQVQRSSLWPPPDVCTP